MIASYSNPHFFYFHSNLVMTLNKNSPFNLLPSQIFDIPSKKQEKQTQMTTFNRGNTWIKIKVEGPIGVSIDRKK